MQDIPSCRRILFHSSVSSEQCDESGYPLGMTGRDKSLLDFICAVADAFDALISELPYRRIIATNEALQHLHDQTGILFDLEIAPVFEKTVTEDQLSDL